jgi:hypothetical protein
MLFYVTQVTFVLRDLKKNARQNVICYLISVCLFLFLFDPEDESVYFCKTTINLYLTTRGNIKKYRLFMTPSTLVESRSLH